MRGLQITLVISAPVCHCSVSGVSTPQIHLALLTEQRHTGHLDGTAASASLTSNLTSWPTLIPRGRIAGMILPGNWLKAPFAGLLVLLLVACNALTGQVRVGDAAASSDEGGADRIDDASPSDGDDVQAEDDEGNPGDETQGDTNEFVSPVGLPVGVVTIGEHVFNVEVATTSGAQLRGLMERESLASDAGMLFIFDEPSMQSFWMLNTPLPLDIAFIREDLTISSTDTMEPLTTTRHESTEPVPYVLEVPADEFVRRGIEAGDVVSVALRE